MTTDTTTEQGSSLVLKSDADYWTAAQLSALEHIGIEGAPPGDLQVFHHVTQRTGLDPFARQIYMIARNGRELVNGNWITVKKWTIQTGIDGFRLIGRRAAQKAGDTISVGAPEWAHEDGTWRPVWTKGWGTPVAARITIQRSNQPFTAVALFDEYAQTKRDGGLTQMWEQRPAGQVAKCAEALAWRMAFPHDLSGVYAEEEMAQADNVRAEQVPRAGGLRGALASQRSSSQGELAPELDGPLDVGSDTALAMFAAFERAGITERDGQLAYVSDVVGRPITGSADLTTSDAARVLDVLTAELEPDPETTVDGEIVEDGK